LGENMQPLSPQRDHTVTTPSQRLKTAPNQRLKSGNPAHELTTDDRRRGAERTNEVKRARRAAAEEKLDGAVDEAIECLVAEMRAKGPDRTRAAIHILDRVLGKSTQRLEGKVELRRAEMIAQAKAELGDELAADAPRVRAKLAELIERRAHSIANEDGRRS
jgi:hypothetical protein